MPAQADKSSKSVRALFLRRRSKRYEDDDQVDELPSLTARTPYPPRSADGSERFGPYLPLPCENDENRDERSVTCTSTKMMAGPATTTPSFWMIVSEASGWLVLVR